MPAFTVATANICGNPLRRQRFVRARVVQSLAAASVVFFQEIATLRYKRAVGRQSGRHGRLARGIRRETPISFPRTWTLLGYGTHRVHGGLKRVSPDRGWSEVRTKHRDGALVAFVNLHPVSKGYAGARHRTTQWQWRHEHLVAYWAAVRKRVEQLRSLGYTVVVGGDCNDPHPAALHLEQRVVASSGLDHLWAVPAPGWHVQVSERHRIPPTHLMDHPILSARITLTKGH